MTLKRIENGWAEGAAGLVGQTTFTRDTNGNLLLVDRGRRKDAAENTVAGFTYDNDGHILGRADKATPGTDANFFQGHNTDPDTTGGVR